MLEQDRPLGLSHKGRTPSVSTHSTAYHMITGEAICAFVEPLRPFDEACRFLPGHALAPSVSLQSWLLEALDHIIVMSTEVTLQTRPFILQLPGIALGETDLAGLADTCITASYLCPQEISLEFTDGALTAQPEASYATLRAFRKCGFRVSIDARRCWQAQLPAHAWLMIDTLRIDPFNLFQDEVLCDRVEAASAAGVSIIADRPAWRDGPRLADHGVYYGRTPSVDA